MYSVGSNAVCISGHRGPKWTMLTVEPLTPFCKSVRGCFSAKSEVVFPDEKVLKIQLTESSAVTDCRAEKIGHFPHYCSLKQKTEP